MTCDYTDADICGWYTSGEGCPSITKRIGRTQPYIDAVLSRNGIKKRGPGRGSGPRPERRTPAEKMDAAVARYLCGESAKSISEATGINKASLLARLRDDGVSIRMQRIDIPIDIAATYRAGTSAASIAYKIGVSKKLILRRLKQAGVGSVEIRVHAKWYEHLSPSAGAVRLRGTWELAYAKFLDILVVNKSIKAWRYEPDKIKLENGRHYIPDFLVTSNDGVDSYHEVKGRLTALSAEKVSLARESGCHVVLVRRALLLPIFRAHGLRAII